MYVWIFDSVLTDETSTYKNGQEARIEKWGVAIVNPVMKLGGDVTCMPLTSHTVASLPAIKLYNRP